MLRSPGTKRCCARPVPDEILIKMALLGVEVRWIAQDGTYVISPIGHARMIATFGYVYIETYGWDEALGSVADSLIKSKHTIKWNDTVGVPTVKIDAAAVINEDAFRE